MQIERGERQREKRTRSERGKVKQKNKKKEREEGSRKHCGKRLSLLSKMLDITRNVGEKTADHMADATSAAERRAGESKEELNNSGWPM